MGREASVSHGMDTKSNNLILGWYSFLSLPSNYEIMKEVSAT